MLVLVPALEFMEILVLVKEGFDGVDLMESCLGRAYMEELDGEVADLF